MSGRRGVVLGVLLGLAAFAAAGSLGLKALVVSWPAYAIAAPTKAYSSAMLLARLGVAVAACAASGFAAARVARTAAWTSALIVLLVSAYRHLVVVWADYPVWYHLAYLALIVPVTLAAARAARARLSP